MKTKTFDQSLHSTVGTKSKIKHGLSGIPRSGKGYSRKAGMFYEYQNFNKEGMTNIIKWSI